MQLSAIIRELLPASFGAQTATLPRSVVVTSRDSKQIADQVWPSLRQFVRRFAGWRTLEGDKRIETRWGGRLRAFTTDDPSRAEGFHSAPGCPLLIVVDEAKSIEPEILQAIDRCSYNCLLYISSPWLMEGPFYEAFTVHRGSWHCFKAGLLDCPHISDAKVQDINTRYGPDSPFAKSALHGEFAEQVEGISHIIELPEIERWRQTQIGLRHGHTVIGCDFAAGGDANVILKRTGNHIDEIIHWREQNTAAAIGRFTRHILRLGYENSKPDHVRVFGDGSGVGRPFCDMLRESGIDICPINFGGAASEPGFKDLGTQLWYTCAQMIKSNQIVAPVNQELAKELFAQLSQRRQKLHSSGKMWMESKEEMRSRGLASPDIADAFAMAFGCAIPTQMSWTPYDDSEKQRIAREHGWDYTPDDSHGQRPGDNEDNGGFGGVHSIWQ